MFKVNNKDTKKTPAGFKGSISVIFFCRSSHRRYSVKKVFLKISQESQKTPGHSLNKVEGLRPAT